IRVNAVVPGWIWGPNVQLYVDWQTQSRGISADDVVAESTDEIPLGEVPPQEDIAEAIVFFASGMSRVITGQTLDVNGGEFFGCPRRWPAAPVSSPAAVPASGAPRRSSSPRAARRWWS